MFPRSFAGSPLPADQQSVIPTVRGLPWWGAMLLATGFTVVGAALSVSSTPPLGRIFKICLVLGAVLAALAVRRRALFTTAVQPPLIAFVVGVITLFTQHEGANDKKTIIIKVVLPIASSFPWMMIAFVAALIVVLGRLFFTGPPSKRPFGGFGAARKPNAKSKSKPASRTKQSSSTKRSSSANGKPTSRDSRRAERSTTRATDESRTTRTAAPAPRKTKPEAPARAEAQRRPARPQRRPAPEQQPTARAPQPQGAQRRTAGQQLRARGQIEDLAAGLDD